MVRLTWDPKDGLVGQGISQGVLYLDTGAYPWNGLVSVEEQDNSTIDTSLFYDGRRHRLPQDTGNFTATVEAYTYPDEFAPYDGLDEFSKHQERQRFGMSYRNEFGNGYELHLVYNALIYPSNNSHISLNENSNISPFSWQLVTTGIDLTWTKAASHLIVDSLEAHPTPLAQLENYIYGTDFSAPRLPSASEVIDLFEDYTTSRITYNGDGTVTMSGPDYMVSEVDETTQEFTVNLPTAFYAYDGVALIRSHWERG